MQRRDGSDESVWADMRERLMGLGVKQLRQIARDESIPLGWAGQRKDTMVAAIVTDRRNRALGKQRDPKTHPWRKWNSVQNMHVSAHV